MPPRGSHERGGRPHFNGMCETQPARSDRRITKMVLVYLVRCVCFRAAKALTAVWVALARVARSASNRPLRCRTSPSSSSLHDVNVLYLEIVHDVHNCTDDCFGPDSIIYRRVLLQSGSGHCPNTLRRDYRAPVNTSRISATGTSERAPALNRSLGRVPTLAERRTERDTAVVHIPGMNIAQRCKAAMRSAKRTRAAQSLCNTVESNPVLPSVLSADPNQTLPAS